MYQTTWSDIFVFLDRLIVLLFLHTTALYENWIKCAILNNLNIWKNIAWFWNCRYYEDNFFFFSVNWFYDFFAIFGVFLSAVYTFIYYLEMKKKTKVYIISIFDARMEAEFSRSWSNNVCYFWNTVAVCFEMLETYTTYNKTR